MSAFSARKLRKNYDDELNRKPWRTLASKLLILSLISVMVARSSLQLSFDLVVWVFCFDATLRISCSCSYLHHCRSSHIGNFYCQIFCTSVKVY